MVDLSKENRDGFTAIILQGVFSFSSWSYYLSYVPYSYSRSLFTFSLHPILHSQSQGSNCEEKKSLVIFEDDIVLSKKSCLCISFENNFQALILINQMSH